MYLPKHFAHADQAVALQIMREHGFATLICADDEGNPYASHLPVMVNERRTDAGPQLVIEGHFARPNPHWRYLQAGRQALVVFQGPDAYMSPRVYPDITRVPTWNYVAVHAYGHAHFLEGEMKKDALLKGLIAIHEAEYAAQWRGLDHEYQVKMLAGIMAFEIPVEKLETKIKLNQHRKEAHAAMKAMYSAGTPDEQALAVWMDKLGL